MLEEIPMTVFLLAWAYLIAGEITALLALADDDATARVNGWLIGVDGGFHMRELPHSS